ncbi:uncharacterized protein C5L36_0B09320 [Pichia kudriavzevii]|uniref:Copper transport protein n=1 Tax=Pichia kudriavzevii TaxID=4909 RepID=A0A2U9R2Z3_PICKU|nr:uncharacterized protein C5L36_0B09320 [Pichia kudriavzevii]AWU75690.1 hypothetical protein C5L36_0B09320 [Pichia kudriavzevii]
MDVSNMNDMSMTSSDTTVMSSISPMTDMDMQHTSGMSHMTTASSTVASSTMAGMATMLASSSSAIPSGDSSMSGMDMSGSDSSDGTMSMTMFMSTKYDNVPVFFRSLHAQTGAAAFGIFCVLFFCSFFFRALVFLSAYLEQCVFHNYSNTIIMEDDCECGESETEVKGTPPPPQNPPVPPFGVIIKKMLWMGPNEFFRDIVRLLIAFTMVMFGYGIMLAAMSFVLTYFFAICLGLAFAEVFFNRLSMILGVNKAFGACAGLH